MVGLGDKGNVQNSICAKTQLHILTPFYAVLELS